MALADILNYYADRLIAQYREQPNARATIHIFAKELVGDDLATALQLAFSIDTAVGPQLDILGKYVGVSRNVGDILPSTQTYFSFTDYASPTGTEHGFLDYTSPDAFPGPVFYLYQYAQGVPSALDDDQYRLVLKLQIVANSSDGTLASLQQAMATFLGGMFSIVDAKDMTIVYQAQSFPPISISVLRRFLPRPMTIGSSVIIVSSTERVLDDGTVRIVDDGRPRALIAG